MSVTGCSGGSSPKGEGRCLRIVLVGKTGTGKSATANSILGRKECISRASLNAQTQECSKKTCVRQGREVTVVDTPGFLDPKTPRLHTRKEVSECVVLCAPGPHAMVVVLQVGRFTKEEEGAITIIQQLFGDQAAKYMVILFTRRDDLEADGQTVQEFVEEAEEGKLKTLLENCGMRYCAFNNRATGEEQERQVSELLSIVDKMVEENGGECYTTEVFQMVEWCLKKEEEKLRNTYQLEKQKAISAIKEKEREVLKQAKTEREKELLIAKYAAKVKRKEEDYRKKAQESRAEAESRLLAIIRGIALGGALGTAIGAVHWGQSLGGSRRIT